MHTWLTSCIKPSVTRLVITPVKSRNRHRAVHEKPALPPVRGRINLCDDVGVRCHFGHRQEVLVSPPSTMMLAPVM